MTIIRSIPSQQYTPRTLNFSQSLPAGTKKILVTLTREAWPEGDVGSISIDYPDGSPAISTTFQGGVQTITTPTGQVHTITTQQMPLVGLFVDGVAQDLPSGAYRVSVVVSQTLTTAVLVERF